ncbi:DUF1800 family protein [Massilia sp. ST3]|uniref:DUF1800 family protein n=1 Tax=Massilia sp. ST3 TaxID=2824903 RepID=UPI001B81ED7B|nr:DUF1800 family protein [Massilia sp. ST3]MBQ5947682.1 DUF1800 family protein [Massilia sp. ST3]
MVRKWIVALCCLLAGAVSAAAPLTAEQALHVLNRMSFGPRPGEVARLQAMGLERYVAEQLDPSRPDLLGEDARRVRELGNARLDADGAEADDLARQERLLRAIASRRQLEEVLVGFRLQQHGAAGMAPAEQARMAETLRPQVFGRVDGDPAAWLRALAERFVGGVPPRRLMSRMEAAWRRSGGDQKEVLRALFTSPDFLAPAAQANKRKDPLRLLASAVRSSGIEVANAAPLARAQVELEEEGMGAWPEVAAALAQGRLPLAAEAPRRHRQASVAPPMRVLPGDRNQPASLASPSTVRPEAPTPSAAAMAAATRTPPLDAALLGSEEFLRY